MTMTQELPPFPEYQYRFRATKPYPTFEEGATISVDANLHYLKGNARPYFSVTGTVYGEGRTENARYRMGGCIHEHIVKHFPELAPVIALHLSDDDGTPLHAKANGWYWVGGIYETGNKYHGGNGTPAKSPAECLTILANHVRLPESEVSAVLADLHQRATNPDGTIDRATFRTLFHEWIAAQSERWQAEADAGITLLKRLAHA